jgi:hypothetical protein
MHEGVTGPILAHWWILRDTWRLCATPGSPGQLISKTQLLVLRFNILILGPHRYTNSSGDEPPLITISTPSLPEIGLFTLCAKLKGIICVISLGLLHDLKLLRTPLLDLLKLNLSEMSQEPLHP